MRRRESVKKSLSPSSRTLWGSAGALMGSDGLSWPSGSHLQLSDKIDEPAASHIWIRPVSHQNLALAYLHPITQRGTSDSGNSTCQQNIAPSLLHYIQFAGQLFYIVTVLFKIWNVFYFTKLLIHSFFQNCYLFKDVLIFMFFSSYDWLSN